MSKDLIRTLLATVASFLAAFFGMPEELLGQTVDFIVATAFGGITLYQIWRSWRKPADNDMPKNPQ